MLFEKLQEYDEDDFPICLCNTLVDLLSPASAGAVNAKSFPSYCEYDGKLSFFKNKKVSRIV